MWEKECELTTKRQGRTWGSGGAVGASLDLVAKKYVREMGRDTKTTSYEEGGLE